MFPAERAEAREHPRRTPDGPDPFGLERPAGPGQVHGPRRGYALGGAEFDQEARLHGEGRPSPW